MSPRRLPLIVALLLLPALASCSEGGYQAPPPPSPESSAAIRNAGGAVRDDLGRAIDSLFDPDHVGATDALVIMKRGDVIAERYAAGVSARTRLPGWAMTQCLTTVMIGQLISDGRLRLNESAPVPDWQRPGDPRGVITLKQLVQMRSGLRNRETADPERRSDRWRMLYLEGRDDMAAYAEVQPLEAAPGQVFAPSSATGVILADLASRVLTDSREPAIRRKVVSDYLHARVLKPLGMGSTQVGFDSAGTLVGSEMAATTAREWALLGEFLRHKGSVKGAQVLPRRWVEFMRAPSPRNPAYGAGIWLNRQPSDNARDIPRATLWPGNGKPDIFACRGEYGQYVIGSPNQLLTVVRLGRSTPEEAALLHERLGQLIELFPG